ncbi:MAG TPA: sulfurtransferase TusA family protein [Aestuariivirga sp.]|nr:sulfurtransferase TusA family protein [Aestuariivirga sp.]
MQAEPDDMLDLSGLLCPLPVLKAGKRLKAMAPGRTLTVIATDPMAETDLPLYCREQGHDFLGCTRDGDTFIFRIRRT